MPSTLSSSWAAPSSAVCQGRGILSHPDHRHIHRARINSSDWGRLGPGDSGCEGKRHLRPTETACKQHETPATSALRPPMRAVAVTMSMPTLLPMCAALRVEARGLGISAPTLNRLRGSEENTMHCKMMKMKTTGVTTKLMYHQGRWTLGH